MKRWVIYLFVILVYNGTLAQSLQQSIATGMIDLQAYRLSNTNPLAVPSNNGSLAGIKKINAALFQERRFLLSGLSNYKLAVAMPMQSGVAALNLGYSGFAGYNESVIGLGYGKELGENIRIGTQFNYYAIKIPGYGTAGVITVAAGAIVKVTDQFTSGFQISNPAGGRFSINKNEKLPAKYSMGLGYAPSDRFFTSLIIIKEEDQPLNVIAGFEYAFTKQLSANTGVSSATSSCWFGIGVQLKSFHLQIFSSYHQLLGISPGMIIAFGQKPGNQ